MTFKYYFFFLSSMFILIHLFILSLFFHSAMFRWFSSSNNDNSNFLKVTNTFTSRRLSDNTLMTPKIRVAPSCESSPGATPGDGLPIRRHSSTGPQDRRGSNINLSPPLVLYLTLYLYQLILILRKIRFVVSFLILQRVL